jgi:hypothetical protein
VALGFVLAGAGNATAGIDIGPVIVVPGRPGVPIMVNGQDVSGAVIEGDWGPRAAACGHHHHPDLPASTGQPWYFTPLMGVDADWRSRRHGPCQTIPDR